MGKRNRLEEDIGDVFDGWAVSQKGKQTRELYEPGRDKDQSRGAKKEGLKQTVKKRPSGTPGQKRTFKDRPTGDDNEAFTPDDNIPEADFFVYFNALYEAVLPSLKPTDRLSRLILCVLFWKSHGNHQNFCQVSFRELESITGAGRNTIRRNLEPLIEDGWVCIISDGYREATMYGLRIPVDFDRGSKIEGLK